MTLDLFNAPILPGFSSQPALIDADEERILIGRIDATDLQPFRFQGWTGNRLTTSFGWSYDFEVGRPREAPPIPEWLLPFRERAAAFAGLALSDERGGRGGGPLAGGDAPQIASFAAIAIPPLQLVT